MPNPNPLLTTEAFIEESSKLHNHKYDYSLSVYTGAFNKVIIICPEHGQFTQQASSHKRGCGCPKCGDKSATFKNTKTQEQFIQEASKKHKNLYNYSKTFYTKAQEHVTVECTIHGDFTQIASDHLRGHGCPICASAVHKFTKKYYTGKRTILYVLHLKDTNTYKVGITSVSVAHRYKLEANTNYTVVFEQHFFNGLHAWMLEKLILRDLKQFKFKGPQIFKHTKNTEILTINPIPTITQRILYEPRTTTKTIY